MNRVGTFDAFLPCELGRRREATLVSAVGPFCAASGEDRASGHQTKIPFLVAATNTTAANTTTERQAQTQIAASSASDFGMCVTTRGFSCQYNRKSKLMTHAIPSPLLAMSPSQHLKSQKIRPLLACGLVHWRNRSGLPSQFRLWCTSQGHRSAQYRAGLLVRLTRQPAPSSQSLQAIRAGASYSRSCATANDIGGPRQSAPASVRGLTRKISSSFCEAA
jgi:hypothetical protein